MNKIFKTYKCTVCGLEINRKTQASTICRACDEWCHIKNCSGLKNATVAKAMSPTFRCQTCVQAGREITAKPKRGRPKGATV